MPQGSRPLTWPRLVGPKLGNSRSWGTHVKVESETPEAMTQTAFAQLAGVSKVTVTKWKKKGFVVLNGEGLVDVERSVAMLVDRGYGNFTPVTQVTQAGSDVTQAGSVPPPPPGRQSADDEEGNCQPTDAELAAALLASGDYALLTHADAERLKENFLALKNRLSYEKDAERLVDKAAVEVRFAERWVTERLAWENRPSAVAADLGAQHGIDAVKMRVLLEQFVEEHLAERVAAEEGRSG